MVNRFGVHIQSQNAANTGLQATGKSAPRLNPAVGPPFQREAWSGAELEDGAPSNESAKVRWRPPFVGRPNTGLQATGRGPTTLSVPLLDRPAPEPSRWARRAKGQKPIGPPVDEARHNSLAL